MGGEVYLDSLWAESDQSRSMSRGHWEGTLWDLYHIVAEQGGDLTTPIMIETDGEPIYFTVMTD